MSDTATGPWREALGFIDTLLTAEPAQRDRLLAQLAASTPELHSRVRALLDADAEATRTGFMRMPSRTDGQATTAALAAGTRLGPYRIERELGTGGMGEVWLARRDDGLYEGEVAIKTLHPFFAHGVMRERFLREAQLLGKLAHPNIARLLDAGVSEGVVFLVLEYVRGESLDEFCDARQLGLDARLKLFGDVCAAVAHAHANLIVHRDIKPSNILVTGQGQVKLLDFGIGKIMEAEGATAERTELTRVTGRIFTPEYAAPEQILGEPVTTATDIYSLGTLLYVLLAGARPFGDLSGAKVEHAVLHDEPRSLSAGAGDADPGIAGHRGLSPARLGRALAGDLEHIVHLAMRKPAQDRYGSVQALADDVLRYRRHQPVRARAGSRAYRAGRFVRRHRVAVAATAGVVLAAAVGVAGVLYQAREAHAQAELARREATKANTVKDYLLDIFEANSARHPDGVEARKTTAEELMDIASEAIIKDEVLDPDVRFELMGTLGNIHSHMEKFTVLEALNQQRIRVAEEKFGVADARLAEALNDHGEFLRTRDRRDEALAAVNRAVALREAQHDTASWTRGVSELELGKIYAGDWAGEDNVPIEHFEHAIAILGKLPPGPELVRAHLGLARAYEFKANYSKAIEINEKGIALAERVDGPRSNSVAGGNQQLARALGFSYRLEEAEEHVQKAVEIFTFIHGPDGGFTTSARLDVARLKNRRGLCREAAALLEPLLAKRLELDGPDSRWVGNIRSVLATSLMTIGDFKRAREQLDAPNVFNAKQKSVVLRAITSRWQARLANLDGRPADAVRHADEGLRNLAQAPDTRDAALYLLRIERVEALIALGRLPEARITLVEARPVVSELDEDPDKYDTIALQLAEAGINLAERDLPGARHKAADALARVRASSRRRDLWHLEDAIQRRLADVELAAGNKPAACTALDEAIRLRSANALGSDPRLSAARKLKLTCT